MSTTIYSEEQMRALMSEARAMVEEVSGCKTRPLGTPSTSAALREEIELTDKVAHELIDLIPPCPAHGRRCLPHAMEWVRARLQMSGT